MNTEKIFQIGAIITFIVLTGTSMRNLYYKYYPWTIMEVQEPIKVLSKEVKVGGIVKYEIEYCKKKPFAGVVIKNMYMSNGEESQSLESTKSSVETGCGVILGEGKGMKSETKPGEYYIELTTTYTVKDFEQKPVTFKTEKFNIVE